MGIRGWMRPNYKHDLSDSFFIDSDNVSWITKLKLGPQIMVLRFNKKSFFDTILAFTPNWDYKEIGKGNYSEENRNSTVIEKILLKCDVLDGSVINGVRQQKLYRFVLDKSSGYKVVSQPETVVYKEKNKCVLNGITFYLENDNHEDVEINGKTLTFTVQMVKFWTIDWVFKNLKLIVISLVKKTKQKTLMLRYRITKKLVKRLSY